MTLDTVAAGRSVLLGPVSLSAARRRRLAELGLRTGQRVQVLHGTAGGGRLLAVGDARVAVDRTTLRAITVGVDDAGTAR